MSRTVSCMVLLVALLGCRQAPSSLGSTDKDPSPVASTPAGVEPSLGGQVLERGLPLGELEIRRGSRSLVRLDVELAESPSAWATGLMNVRNLPKGTGMAFLFPALTQFSFTMKDTLVPLDIAFWDERMAIVDIMQMTPCDNDPCQAYTPTHHYVGALEVNQGFLDSKGIRVGDQVTLKRRS